MDMREALLQAQKLAVKITAKEMVDRVEQVASPEKISVESSVSQHTGRTYTEIKIEGENGASMHVMMWGARP